MKRVGRGLSMCRCESSVQPRVIVIHKIFSLEQSSLTQKRWINLMVGSGSIWTTRHKTLVLLRPKNCKGSTRTNNSPTRRMVRNGIFCSFFLFCPGLTLPPHSFVCCLSSNMHPHHQLSRQCLLNCYHCVPNHCRCEPH